MTWQVELRGKIGALRIDVRFETEPGPNVLIGPNGAGKTTLLRAMTGARLPLVGRIRLNGRVLFDSDAGIHVPPEKRGVGYVPQGYALFEHLTALDNVAFGSASRAEALRTLERFDAQDLADRFPGELSGGERQRVALARALAVDPAGLLLDEPLAALDARTRRRMRQFLTEYLAQQSRPALVVSHDVRDVLALGQHVLVLEGGSIAQRGSAEALSRAPGTDFVAELFDTPSGSAPGGNAS